jgi:phosphatidylglycerophosphate synthase
VFDRRLQPLLARIYGPPARRLASRGIGADAVTIVGFAIGVAGSLFIGAGAFGLGLVLITLNRIFDGLDGALARVSGPTDRGAFLDISLDFVFYASVPFAFAVADPSANALPAAALLLAFMGTASSFLAFAAVAARRGDVEPAFPGKGIHYLGGLTEGGETIAVFVLMCLRPDWFAPLAYGFATLCLLTTLTRWVWGWRAFA